jgi:hypothetical protein
MKTISILLFVLVFSAVGAAAVYDLAADPVYDGLEMDYQPSILRAEDGRLIIVFERLNKTTFFGDLYVTTSSDEGVSWSMPAAIINSTANERHPALLQLGVNSYILFYLKDVGSSQYRIYYATSSDATTWSEVGQVDLGWITSGEINPDVIVDESGTLTMVYHRLSGSSYIAQSTDGGTTWDQLKTQVSNGTAQLPRIAKRESDELYILTYQVGSSDMDIFSKFSTDPYNWPSEQVDLSTAYNSHDPKPIVLADGNILVTYAQATVNRFDLHYRYSMDSGASWSESTQLTFNINNDDTQPHPLLSNLPDQFLLTWSHQDSGLDQDVWFWDNVSLPFEYIYLPILMRQ